MSFDEFPSEISLLIVDNLYEHYDLGFNDDREDVHVYCDRCEDIVCNLDYNDIVHYNECALYKYIIDEHRKI